MRLSSHLSMNQPCLMACHSWSPQTWNKTMSGPRALRWGLAEGIEASRRCTCISTTHSSAAVRAGATGLLAARHSGVDRRGDLTY